MTALKEKTGISAPVLFALLLFRLVLSVFPACPYDFYAVLFICIRFFDCAFPAFVSIGLDIAGSAAHVIHLSFLLFAAPVLARTLCCSLCRYPARDQRSIPALAEAGLPFPGTRHEMRPCQLQRNTHSYSLQALNALADHQNKKRNFPGQTKRQPVLCPLHAGSSTTTALCLCTPAISAEQAACLRKQKNLANKHIGNFAAFQSTFLADSTLFQTRNRA